MKKTTLFLICLLASSMLLFASAQNVQAAANNQVQEVPKVSLPAPKVIKLKLDNMVTQSILTKEQADKIFEQLNTTKSPDLNQLITPAELKSRLVNLLTAHIVTEAQAITAINIICKNMPEGFPDIPEQTAAYNQKGKIVSKTKQNYVVSRQNESGVVVSHNGKLLLTSSTIKTSGSTSFESFSNFFGTNAGVLAQSGSTINLLNSTIETTGDGAHSAFATGIASVVTLAKVKIITIGDSACGLAATAGGTIQADNMDIATAGKYSPAIAADRVNGTVVVRNAIVKTTGQDSPGIYSIGTIKISDTSIAAANSEAAIIEGRSSLSLTNTTISGAKTWGVLMFQGYTGNLEQGVSSFTMNGGSLTATEGPAFYVTNIEGNIDLTDAAIAAPSKKLLEVAAGRWGTKEANGGKLNFTATRENLTGSIFCDNISTLTINLKDHTTLTSTINDVRTAGSVNLILDNTSIWKVAGNSYLSSLTDLDKTLANIQDNGFTIYYDARLAANKWLDGKTYALKGGGKLTPSEKL